MGRYKWALIGGTLVALALVVVVVGVQISNQQRWNSQRIEAASVIEFFCKYNLPVSAAECQNWAYQTVNNAPSTTDGILLCNRVFWNGASNRDQRAFVSCLARAEVYVPA